MMALSASVGAASGVIGLYLSFYGNIASGPAIVLTSTALFLLALFFSPSQGLVKKWLADHHDRRADAQAG